MFKNLFDAITDGVEAFKIGIVIGILVILLYLAKIYFSIYPPKESSLTKIPEIKEVIFDDINKWLKAKKEVSPKYNRICVVDFGRDKKCLLVAPIDELSISLFYRTSSYAISKKFDLLINICSNSSDLNKELNSVWYKELYKGSLRLKNYRKTICRNCSSQNFEQEVNRFFRVDKTKSIIEYELFNFLKERQVF